MIRGATANPPNEWMIKQPLCRNTVSRENTSRLNNLSFHSSEGLKNLQICRKKKTTRAPLVTSVATRSDQKGQQAVWRGNRGKCSGCAFRAFFVSRQSVTATGSIAEDRNMRNEGWWPHVMGSKEIGNSWENSGGFHSSRGHTLKRKNLHWKRRCQEVYLILLQTILLSGKEKISSWQIVGTDSNRGFLVWRSKWINLFPDDVNIPGKSLF